MEREQSYTKVDAQGVFEACERFMSAKLREVQALQEEQIQKEMRGGWFKPAKDRDAAIKVLYGDLWNDMDWVFMAGEYQVKRINELQQVARYAAQYADERKMYLYAEDATILKNFF